MPNKRIEFTEPLLLEKPAPTFAPDAPIMRFTDALMTAGWQVYHRYTDRAVVGFCSLNGAAHYKYLLEASLLAHSNDTVIDAWRYRPDGTLDAHATIPYPTEAGAEYKAESGVLWLALEGADLVVYDGFHLAVTTDARPSVTAIYSVAGFVVDPYPQGVAPMGTSFNLAGLPGTAGQPTPSGLSDADKTWIQTAITAAVTAGFALFGPEGVRTAILHKVWDAEVALWDEHNRTDPRLQAFRDGAAQFIRDRCYEAIQAAHGPTPGKTTAAPSGEPGGPQMPAPSGTTDSGDAQP